MNFYGDFFNILTSYILSFLKTYLHFMAIGIFGGFVRESQSECFSLKIFIIGFLTSGFVSLLVSLWIKDFDIGLEKKLVIVGASGYCYRVVLEFINVYVTRKIDDLKVQKNRAVEKPLKEKVKKDGE